MTDTSVNQPASPPQHVLVVDDEAHIREVLARYLVAAGYVVTEAADGPSALKAVATQPLDIIVLDLMLPGMDGREVTRLIRASSAIPIIMLTALGEEEERLAGFALGADDYVTKPFSPREVVVRVTAVLRRVEAAMVPAMVRDDGVIHCAGLTIQPALRRVQQGDALLDLTAKEFDLLLFLARHPNQVFTRQQVLDAVWGYDFFGDASTVTVHIRRLREKVERDPADPLHVKTVWGVGYKFEP